MSFALCTFLPTNQGTNIFPHNLQADSRILYNDDDDDDDGGGSCDDDDVCPFHKFIAQDHEDEHIGDILSALRVILENSVFLKYCVWILY